MVRPLVKFLFFCDCNFFKMCSFEPLAFFSWYTLWIQFQQKNSQKQAIVFHAFFVTILHVKKAIMINTF